MTNPDEPVPEDPREDRRHERSLGRLAVIGALLAALLGAVGGGIGTYLSNRQTATSASAEAQQEFLRTQRQTVYARFVGDARYLIDYLPRSYTSAAPGTPPTTNPKADKLVQQLRLDLYSVQLVGSDSSAKAALALNLEIDGMANAAEGVETGGTGPHYQPSVDDLKTFVREARKDLGVR